jgi:hypothetical protein
VHLLEEFGKKKPGAWILLEERIESEMRPKDRVKSGLLSG